MMELEIRPGGRVAPIRASIRRALTTVGSDSQADIAVAGLPARWAVLQRESDELVIRLLGSSECHRIASGGRVQVGGVELSLRPQHEPGQDSAGAGEPLQLQGLTDRLSHVEDPQEALSLLLRELIEATGADLGAVILQEQGNYTVAADQRRDGTPVPGSGGLLSDHIVREVLAGGEQVTVDDVRQVPRYARIPSLTMLRLRSVLCVPMRLHGVVLGAIFLGRTESPFEKQRAAELGMVTALAVPFLVQMRRIESIEGKALGTDHAYTDPTEVLVGEASTMLDVRRLITRVAPSDLSVLILGETGTGKEVVARALHQASPRRARPLITLNCASVPESLLEAELFGARRGAFTGAVTDRVGRIEQADGSTLFLDELGDMPLSMQAALLRVLEQREVVRLGENVPRPVNFRLVAATHRDLEAEVAAGRFREDLLYRLKEIVIELPALTRRGGDVLLLAQLFLRQTEQQLELPGRRIGAAAAEALLAYPWPGNVRELRATMRRAAILCDGREIGVEHLGFGGNPPSLCEAEPANNASHESAFALEKLDLPLAEARDRFVTGYVSAVLERHGGNREQAARALGISVRSLYRYLSS